ncbi:MAG: hypothetical protein WKG01_01250 [Kofleriaceae bacterium]
MLPLLIRPVVVSKSSFSARSEPVAPSSMLGMTPFEGTSARQWGGSVATQPIVQVTRPVQSTRSCSSQVTAVTQPSVPPSSEPSVTQRSAMQRSPLGHSPLAHGAPLGGAGW